MLLQPLAQFEITFLGWYKGFIPIDTGTLYMFFVYFIIRFFFSMTKKGKPMLIPNYWQNVLELIYEFVLDLLVQQCGDRGKKYFPLIYTLFLFILVSNLLGMTLYSFTITSHAIITFALSFALFIGIVITGIMEQGWKFVYTFIPAGAPLYLLPFMIFVEIISYFSRPISLAIRLFANMMSGHTLLAILANFVLKISKKYFLISIIPFFLIVLIIGLELMIAVLQAYVFTILICIYLNDSLHGSH